MKNLSLASTLVAGLASLAVPMEALADIECGFYGMVNATMVSRTDSAPMCALLVQTNRHGTVWQVGTPAFYFIVYRGKDGDVISEYHDDLGRVIRRKYGYWSFQGSGWRAVFRDGTRLFVGTRPQF